MEHHFGLNTLEGRIYIVFRSNTPSNVLDTRDPIFGDIHIKDEDLGDVGRNRQLLCDMMAKKSAPAENKGCT